MRPATELNTMATDYPSFGAMVSDLRASPLPSDKDLAEGIETFIAGWQAKAAPPVAQ